MDEQKLKEFIKQLEEAESGFPETWDPKTFGETLTGQVLRYERVSSKYGNDKVLICIVQSLDGKEFSVWITRAKLIARFSDLNPKVGEIVGIRYLGEVVGKTGKRYHDYAVMVFGREGTGILDASDLARPEEPAA